MREIDTVYEDIVFSHYEYSNIIFDAMYELVEKVVGEAEVFSRSALAPYHLDLRDVKALQSEAIDARHHMRVETFIDRHNELMPAFNRFLKGLGLDSLPLYTGEHYERDKKHLVIHNVAHELNILKLHEQYIVLKAYEHPRKCLRLQMFFENAVRYFLDVDKTLRFYSILTDYERMETFVRMVSDGAIRSKSQIEALMYDLKRLNTRRNKIKHDADYSVKVNYERLERFIILIVQKMKNVVRENDEVVFRGKQSLLEHHLAFRELSFDYKYETLSRLGEDVLFDKELIGLFKDDRAFQVYYVNTLMESDTMKLIHDYEKIQDTIQEFHELVSALEKLNETYSDAKDDIESALSNIQEFSALNKKLETLKKVDLDKLDKLLRFQEKYADNTELEQLLDKLGERLELLKEGNTLLRNNKKQLKNFLTQIEKIQT